MSVTQCRWLALGVLALGICAAVPFSKESAAISPPTSPELLPQSPYPEFGDLTLQVSSASESGEVESVLPSRPTSPQSSQSAPSRTLSSIPTLRDTPPPELPRHYAPVLSGNTSPLPDPQRPQSWPLQIGRTDASAGSTSQPHPAVASEEQTLPSAADVAAGRESRTVPSPIKTARQPAVAGDDGDAESSGSGDKRIEKKALAGEPAMPATVAALAQLPPSKSIRHRIVDGDTLELLAERHFGSQDRAADIYRDNQHVLSAPDLLPIGAELVIHVPADPRELTDAASVAPAARPLVPLNAADLAALRSRTTAP